MTFFELAGFLLVVEFFMTWVCVVAVALWRLASVGGRWLVYHVFPVVATPRGGGAFSRRWSPTDEEVLMKTNQPQPAPGAFESGELAGIIDLRESFVEAPLRAEIRELLWKVEYPASGDDLLREAVRNRLSPQAIRVLHNARGRSYDGCYAVCRRLHL